MKQQNIFRATAVTLLCTAVLCFFSCKKKEKGIFYIKGQLMDSCNGNPVVGEKLVVSYSSKGTWVTASKSNDSAGGVVTDMNGNFYIQCENGGDAKYSICDTKNKCISLYLNKKDNEVEVLGPVYQKYKVLVCIQFSFSSLSSSDTFYYGYSKTPKQLFFPIPGSKIINYSYVVYTGISEPPELREYKANWGWGIKGYENARNTGINQITVREGICVADTSFVSIP